MQENLVIQSKLCGRHISKALIIGRTDSHVKVILPKSRMIITHRITEGRKRKTLRRRRDGERTSEEGANLCKSEIMIVWHWQTDRGARRVEKTDLLQVQAKNISAEFSDTCPVRAGDPEMSD